jgi:hypothetical protein
LVRTISNVLVMEIGWTDVGSGGYILLVFFRDKQFSHIMNVNVHPISITKTLLIVLTKNEMDPPLFTDNLLIKFQNILRNTSQVIRHKVKILFSVISSER